MRVKDQIRSKKSKKKQMYIININEKPNSHKEEERGSGEKQAMSYHLFQVYI